MASTIDTVRAADNVEAGRQPQTGNTDLLPFSDRGIEMLRTLNRVFEALCESAGDGTAEPNVSPVPLG